MDNRTYWEKRAEIREVRAYSNCLEATNGLVNAYRQAGADIRREINDFYNRFANENGLTYADAVQYLNREEALEWRTSVEGYINEIRREADPVVRERLMQEYDARAYGARITRLESLSGDIDMQLSRLYARANEQFRQLLGENFTEGYYRTIFDIQSRHGYSSMFAAVDPRMVENALTYPWSGANFSDRLWKHKGELLNTLRETLTRGLIRGDSVQDMAKNLSERLNASRANAMRLMRTESSHIHNTAELEAYKACGFEEYEFMASFGEKTCEVCGGLDGQRFKLADKQFGVNFPPVHPNCRCTTIAYDPDDNLEDMKSGELDYEHWYQKYVEGREQERIETGDETQAALPGNRKEQIAEHQTAPALISSNNSGGQSVTSGNGVDVKNLYDRIATPGKGGVSHDNGYNVNTHKAEIEFADWLHSYYGGDIHLLSEINQNKVSTPDYLWNKRLWDLKSVTTEKAANSAIRKGLKQIASNPGGVILNYGDADISLDLLQSVIDKRMHWYGGATVDIMVVNKKNVIKVLRYGQR